MQGVVKVYDATTGIGVILGDGDTGEVMLRPGSLEGSLFRMLRQGQRVVFDVSDHDGTPVAGNLRFGADGK
jgi:CspA family cold shock protein